MPDIIGMENEIPNPPSGSSAPATGAGSSPGPKLTKGGADASKTLAGLPIDLGMITDPVVRQAMTVLLNPELLT